MKRPTSTLMEVVLHVSARRLHTVLEAVDRHADVISVTRVTGSTPTPTKRRRTTKTAGSPPGRVTPHPWHPKQPSKTWKRGLQAGISVEDLALTTIRNLGGRASATAVSRAFVAAGSGRNSVGPVLSRLIAQKKLIRLKRNLYELPQAKEPPAKSAPSPSVSSALPAQPRRTGGRPPKNGTQTQEQFTLKYLQDAPGVVLASQLVTEYAKHGWAGNSCHAMLYKLKARKLVRALGDGKWIAPGKTIHLGATAALLEKRADKMLEGNG